MRGRRVIMDEKPDAVFSKLRITIEPFGFLFVTATVLQVHNINQYILLWFVIDSIHFLFPDSRHTEFASV